MSNCPESYCQNGWMDGQTERWMDGQTDGQTSEYLSRKVPGGRIIKQCCAFCLLVMNPCINLNQGKKLIKYELVSVKMDRWMDRHQNIAIGRFLGGTSSDNPGLFVY